MSTGGGTTDPGSTGDVHVETLAGEAYDFPGGGHRRYKFYEQGPVSILTRDTEVPGDQPGSGRTYCEGVDCYFEAPCQVYIGSDGKVNIFCGGFEFSAVVKCDTIDAPGHPGCTQDTPHPLMGVPHINLTVPLAPPSRPGESGLIVTRDARPDDFAVDG